MIADMIKRDMRYIRDKIAHLNIRGRKLNNSVVVITQLYFKMQKDVRLNSKLFIEKIPNKRELQKIARNHSSDIDFKYFTKI